MHKIEVKTIKKAKALLAQFQILFMQEVVGTLSLIKFVLIIDVNVTLMFFGSNKRQPTTIP